MFFTKSITKIVVKKQKFYDNDYKDFRYDTICTVPLVHKGNEYWFNLSRKTREKILERGGVKIKSYQFGILKLQWFLLIKIIGYVLVYVV